MNYPAQMYWTIADVNAGLCGTDDLGHPRPNPFVADSPRDVGTEPLPNLTEEELDYIPAKLLKRDALRAYQRLGGANWLVQNPTLLGKVLLRTLPTELNTDERRTLDVHITWAGPDRLSYQAKEIVDAEVVGPAPGKEPSTPWRPIDPDTTALNASARLGAELEVKKPK